MNNNWFECGIRYDKVMEDGKRKKVTEQYLVKGFSFTDAEAKIIEEISAYIDSEYTVSTIKRANYSEIFATYESDSEYWFKCKVAFVTINERTGKEKKTACYMLIQAKSTEDATQKLNNEMNGTVSDYQIASVSETNIYDVFFNEK